MEYGDKWDEGTSQPGDVFFFTNPERHGDYARIWLYLGDRKYAELSKTVMRNHGKVSTFTFDSRLAKKSIYIGDISTFGDELLAKFLETK